MGGAGITGERDQVTKGSCYLTVSVQTCMGEGGGL